MFISTKEFAEAAGLDRRSAARICKEAYHSGKMWFGHSLDVQLERGRKGGRSGARYKVSVASLPDLFRNLDPVKGCAESSGLTQRPPASRLDHARVLATRDRRSAVLMQRYNAIRFALQAPRGSEERRFRISAAAVQARVSEATIYRWLGEYEAGGLASLAPRIREQKPSVITVSRHFDSRFHEQNSDADGKLELVGEELTRLIKIMWTTRESMGGLNQMARVLQNEIADFCVSKGFSIDNVDCTPSVSRIRAFREYSLVRTFLYDAKKCQSILPRIRRNYVDVAPMEIVFVDVKYCDIYIQEGSTRTRPALIGFYDVGTGRLFSHLVRVGKGTSIPKAHVLDALFNMVTHANWGVPQALYTDNGSEMFGLLDGIAALSNIGQGCPLIRALPNNPQSKPIEGLFGNLNRIVFSRMPGFTGGKKRRLRETLTQRGPDKYPGTWDDFCGDLSNRLVEYHSFKRPRRPSPDELFHQKLISTNTDLHVLSVEDALAAFGEEVWRRIRQGSITYAGTAYHDRSFYNRHGQQQQFAVKPGLLSSATASEDGGQQPSVPHYVRLDGQLHPTRLDASYHPLDGDGARDSHLRQDVVGRRVVEMSREVDGLSPSSSAMQAVTHKMNQMRSRRQATTAAVTAEVRISPKQRKEEERKHERAELEHRIRQERLRAAR